MKNFLFFDVDGTLVDAGNVVVDSAWKAIEACRANGDYVFICSGRTRISAEGFRHPEMDGTIFCSGGGVMTKDHGTVYFPIPEEDCKRLIEAAKTYKVGVMAFTECYGYGDELALDHMIGFGKAYGNHTAEEVLSIYTAAPLSQYRGEPILKFDLYFPDEETCRLFEKEYIPESMVWNRMSAANADGEGVYGEVNPRNVSKGSAVLEVLKLYGGEVKKAYGFGDSMNDAEMLKTCGTGIAMGNGVPALKELADYITDSLQEDGVAKAMRHFGLVK